MGCERTDTNQRVGLWRWSSHGKPLAMGFFEHGRPVGTWKIWNLAGDYLTFKPSPHPDLPFDAFYGTGADLGRGVCHGPRLGTGWQAWERNGLPTASEHVAEVLTGLCNALHLLTSLAFPSAELDGGRYE